VKAQAPTEKKRAYAPAPSRRPAAVSQPSKTIRGGSAEKAPREKGVARSSSSSDYRPAPAPRREEAPRPAAPPQVSGPESHGSAHGSGKQPAVKSKPQPKGASAGPPPKQKGKKGPG
jgi:hypothetical protein